MRNLKKLLALVLAMVMAFSLMLSASAVDFKDYPDKDQITEQFTEAVQVLTGLKVFKGDEAGNFNPGKSITRAEVAAIIYRMVTGDVTDGQVNIYADYGNFVDVKSSDWFAGYVGYCANAEYIKGHNGYFRPNDTVTGYEALAMILRAVGYDQNHEFEGAAWQTRVASLSRELGVTTNVKNANFENTLTVAARRDVVADLLFQTATKVNTVTYTPALGYNKNDKVIDGSLNPTLGLKVFDLRVTNYMPADEWGRPGYFWVKDATGVTAANRAAGVTDALGVGRLLSNGSIVGWRNASNIVATIIAKPELEFHEQKRECDVAEALKFDTTRDYILFVNDDVAVTNNYRIVPTDTVTKVGGTGRLTEFYPNLTSHNGVSYKRSVVMIDTFLAKVTGKAAAKLDPAGHVITPAKLDVDIYDQSQQRTTDITRSVNNAVKVITKSATSKENWDEYNVGDYILIHAYTGKDTGRDVDNVQLLHGGTQTEAQKEKAAFETNRVVDKRYDTSAISANNQLTINKEVWIEGKADVKTGKQTVVYYNQNKHCVDGTDYDDQICLFLDRAGTTTNTTYNWYFDQYGKLIGIGDAKSVNFGVITAVYASFGQGETQTNGTAKAIATVLYADGTTGTVEIDRFLMSKSITASQAAISQGRVTKALSLTYETGTITPATDLKIGGALVTTPDTDHNGTHVNTSNTHTTVDLRPVYDTGANPALSAVHALVPFTPVGAEVDGWLYMAPSTASNTNAHFASSAGAGVNDKSTDVYGILWDNLFKFETASDDNVAAIEVAGDGTNANTFNRLHNDVVKDATPDLGTGNSVGMIYKSLGFLTLDCGTTTAPTGGHPGDADVRLDDETKIMIRTGNTTINTYDGVSKLPGNVVLPFGTEVDWADTDNDGKAEFLYVRGNIPGVITYGLFYYNPGAQYAGIDCTAQWDGTTNTGTISGYLNGEAATITIKGATNKRNIFDVINSTGASYKGHLYAVQITNDEVTDLLETAKKNDNTTAQTAQSNQNEQLLNYSSNSTGISIGHGLSTHSALNDNTDYLGTTANPTTAFVLGTPGGNGYSNTTGAIYYRSEPANMTVDGVYSSVSYSRTTGTNNGEVRVVNTVVDNAGAGTTKLADQTYWQSYSSKIIGELEWLNTRNCDVTIVYDNTAANINGNVILEIYITPDRDVTPNVTTGTATATKPVMAGCVRSGGSTPTSLAEAVEFGANNTVVWGSDSTTNETTMAAPPLANGKADKLFGTSGADMNVGESTDVYGNRNWLSNHLFFPYAVDIQNLTVKEATLTITKANGDFVYGENSGTLTNAGMLSGGGAGSGVFAGPAGQHYFVVNFAGTGDNASGAPSGRLTLTAGETYYFTITVTTAAGVQIISSGSFTME